MLVGKLENDPLMTYECQMMIALDNMIKGIMSQTIIVTPKLYTCTLLSTMAVLIMGDILQGVCGGNIMALDPLEFRLGNLVEFTSLSLVKDLMLKRRLSQPYTHCLGTKVVLLISLR